MIMSKRHFNYFINYLGENGLSAKTIVIEDEYVSKDFLHDYASYYALCFQQYPKFCKRVHFFSSEFSQEELNEHILSLEPSDFWDSYLGFTVVRPIPLTVIGYTVFKTYETVDPAGDRNYWGLRKYQVHLFGRVIKFNSLAFQEQDSVLAACATTAIWTMLNKASIDFSTILKVPSEITLDAGKLQTDGNRLFPNKGLTIPQISKAIHISGLAPEVRGANIIVPDPLNEQTECLTSDFVKKIVNAYEAIGIPIILGIKVPMDGIDGPQYGYHAVAVLGHKVCPLDDPQFLESPWIANRITKLYLHDDQYGPFARAKFISDVEIQTPWTESHSAQFPSYIKFLVAPVYPKIRISYEDIESLVIGIYSILARKFEDEIQQYWDIKIHYSEQYKKQILNFDLDSVEKLKLLNSSMPKYLWVATLYAGNVKMMEFTFDATEVNTAMIGKHITTYLQEEVKDSIKQYIIANREDIHPLFGQAGIKYIEFLVDNI